MIERDALVALVTRAQEGDRFAMEELFGAFYPSIYYLAKKTVKDETLACDVTQDTFEQIMTHLGELKEPAAFVSWAKRIAYFQCTRHFRKKTDLLAEENEEGETLFDELTEDAAEFIPEEALEREELRHTVMGIVNNLPDEQRTAIMMYYFDEFSVKTIAELQGVSEGTVKSRLNYGRKAIKKAVEDYEEKHETKLHAIGFFPLLRWLFREDALAESMPAAEAEAIRQGLGFSETPSAPFVSEGAGAPPDAAPAGAASGGATAAATAVAAAPVGKGLLALLGVVIALAVAAGGVVLLGKSLFGGGAIGTEADSADGSLTEVFGNESTSDTDGGTSDTETASEILVYVGYGNDSTGFHMLSYDHRFELTVEQIGDLLYLRHFKIRYEDTVTFDTDLIALTPLRVGEGVTGYTVGYVTSRLDFIGNDVTELLLDYDAEDGVFILPARYPSPYEATLSLSS